MQRLTISCLLVMVCGGLAAAQTPLIAPAATTALSPDDYAVRLAELEEELSGLKYQLASFQLMEPAAFHSGCGSDGGCGCDSVCGCDGCCGSNCCGGGLYAGYSFVFAKPHFKEAFQASVIDLTTGTQNMLPFQYGYELTPRVWLGYTNPDGLGFRTTYWQFNHDGAPRTIVADATTIPSAHALTVIFPATITASTPGDVLYTSDELYTQTLDIEGTLPGHFDSVTVLVSGGLRYTRLEQNLNSTVSSGGTVTQILSWSRTFEGLGPTMGAEFHYRLGCSNFALFGSGRGALMYGKKSLNRFVSPTDPPNTPTPFASLEEADEVVGMGEVQLGMEWRRQTARGWDLLVRGTYEGSLWAEAGAPTLGFLGFEGFAFSLGIER